MHISDVFFQCLEGQSPASSVWKSLRHKSSLIETISLLESLEQFFESGEKLTEFGLFAPSVYLQTILHDKDDEKAVLTSEIFHMFAFMLVFAIACDFESAKYFDHNANLLRTECPATEDVWEGWDAVIDGKGCARTHPGDTAERLYVHPSWFRAKSPLMVVLHYVRSKSWNKNCLEGKLEPRDQKHRLIAVNFAFRSLLSKTIGILHGQLDTATTLQAKILSGAVTAAIAFINFLFRQGNETA